METMNYRTTPGFLSLSRADQKRVRDMIANGDSDGADMLLNQGLNKYQTQTRLMGGINIAGTAANLLMEDKSINTSTYDDTIGNSERNKMVAGSALEGGVKGASAGATFGVAGAAIGAGIGALISAFKQRREVRKANRAIRGNKWSKTASESLIASNDKQASYDSATPFTQNLSKGGFVKGKGSPRKDTEKTKLDAGDYVMPTPENEEDKEIVNAIASVIGQQKELKKNDKKKGEAVALAPGELVIPKDEVTKADTVANQLGTSLKEIQGNILADRKEIPKSLTLVEGKENVKDSPNTFREEHRVDSRKFRDIQGVMMQALLKKNPELIEGLSEYFENSKGYDRRTVQEDAERLINRLGDKKLTVEEKKKVFEENPELGTYEEYMALGERKRENPFYNTVKINTQGVNEEFINPALQHFGLRNALDIHNWSSDKGEDSPYVWKQIIDEYVNNKKGGRKEMNRGGFVGDDPVIKQIINLIKNGELNISQAKKIFNLDNLSVRKVADRLNKAKESLSTLGSKTEISNNFSVKSREKDPDETLRGMVKEKISEGKMRNKIKREKRKEFKSETPGGTESMLEKDMRLGDISQGLTGVSQVVSGLISQRKHEKEFKKGQKRQRRRSEESGAALQKIAAKKLENIENENKLLGNTMHRLKRDAAQSFAQNSMTTQEFNTNTAKMTGMSGDIMSKALADNRAAKNEVLNEKYAGQVKLRDDLNTLDQGVGKFNIAKATQAGLTSQAGFQNIADLIKEKRDRMEREKYSQTLIGQAEAQSESRRRIREITGEDLDLEKLYQMLLNKQK